MDQGLFQMAEGYGVNPTGLPSIPMPPMGDMDAGPQQQTPQMPQQSPQGMPQAAQMPGNPLAAMYAKYQPDPAYAAQLREAQAREAAERNAFNQLIEQSASQKTEGPSQAEIFFRLASAFGAPTRSGNFFESLGNAGKAMADVEAEKRAGAAADRKNNLGMRLEQRKLGLQSAKDETAALRSLMSQDAQLQRSLAMEDSKSQRETALAMLKAQLSEGKVQSEAGKLALDAGLQQGTPEFNAFVKKYVVDKLESGNVFKQMAAAVAQGNLAVAQGNQDIARMRLEMDADRERNRLKERSKLTPTEMKLKTETQDLVNTLSGVETNLAEALKLNSKTFDTSIADTVQRKLLENTQSNHHKVVATRDQENLLAEQAVSGLKASFGGNPTEGERKILLDLQGIGAKSLEERKRIIERAQKAAARRKAFQQQRLDDISAGKYRDTNSDREE